MSDLEVVLRSVPPLLAAGEEDRRALANEVTTHVYPKGNRIHHHGEPCSAVFFVISGRAKVSLMNEDGREVVLRTVRRGDVFGLDAALGNAPYFGTCTVTTRSQLGKIPRESFLAWLRERPNVQEQILFDLARGLRSAYEKIGEQALLSVKRRLLMAIVDLARLEGIPGQRGELSFIRPTHQELAEIVGSTRVVISRMLKELLQEETAITARGNVIRVYPDDLVLADPVSDP